jgi:hypothetical protein
MLGRHAYEGAFVGLDCFATHSNSNGKIIQGKPKREALSSDSPSNALVD